MITPDIRYYARFEYSKDSKKTPKYTIIKQAGYYEPMEFIKGRDGKISMYLMEKLKDGANVPSMRLQAARSLNFTGLKDYFVDGELSGYAFGYPDDRPTFSSKKLNNPFYKYKNDGYLFLFETSKDQSKGVIPTSFELIVLEGGRLLIASYCKMLVMGGFDEALNLLREQAK